MNAVYRNLAISSLVSIGFGIGGTMLIVNSANGYVAGFVFLPIFFFLGLVSLILFVVGFICLGLKNKSWTWVLLSAFLLPASFFSTCLTAKHFELGAYRQEPMIPFPEEISNVILFRTGATNEQINEFWDKNVSIEQADGRGYSNLPGVGTMGRNQTHNGHEVIDFSFFPNATEEQKQFVFAKIKSSPLVYQLLENQSMKEWNASSETSTPSSNSNVPSEKGVMTGSANSK